MVRKKRKCRKDKGTLTLYEKCYRISKSMSPANKHTSRPQKSKNEVTESTESKGCACSWSSAWIYLSGSTFLNSVADLKENFPVSLIFLRINENDEHAMNSLRSNNQTKMSVGMVFLGVSAKP